MTKTFFQPLQMTDTYVYGLTDSAKATRSYRMNGRMYPMEYLDLVYGDKNIYSTPEDMLKWDAALRGAVMFNNPRWTAPTHLIVWKNREGETTDLAGECSFILMEKNSSTTTLVAWQQNGFYPYDRRKRNHHCTLQ